jgi:hypothetical protein
MVYGIVTSASCLFLSWFTFKNYSNIFLIAFIKNIAVNSIIDLLVLRSISFVLLSIVLRFNNTFLQYIEN